MRVFHTFPTRRSSDLVAGHGLPGPVVLAVVVRSEIPKADKLALEDQLEAARCADSVLPDDDFRRALVLGIPVVNLIAVDQQNQSSILFNRAGFTPVGHARALVR